MNGLNLDWNDVKDEFGGNPLVEVDVLDEDIRFGIPNHPTQCGAARAFLAEVKEWCDPGECSPIKVWVNASKIHVLWNGINIYWIDDAYPESLLSFVAKTDGKGGGEPEPFSFTLDLRKAIFRRVIKRAVPAKASDPKGGRTSYTPTRNRDLESALARLRNGD